MANILTEYSDRVRYTLHNNTYGTISITDPIGWDEDEKEFSRNKTYHGIFTTLSNSLKFTKDAKDFIKLVYDTLGINADLRLVKESKNSITDVWEQSYSGYLDLSTYEIENNQVSCKFNSGGLESILKSREGDQVEIDRRDTIDEKPIEELQTVEVEIAGRRIFLESIWEVEPMNYYQELRVESRDGNTRTISGGIGTKLIKKSHDEAGTTFSGVTGTYTNGVTSFMLLTPVNRPREFQVSIKDLIFQCYSIYGSVDWGHANITLVRYGDGSNYTVLERIDLWLAHSENNTPPIYGGNYGGVQTVNHYREIVLNQNESLGLEVLLRADLISGGGTGNVKADFWYKFSKGRIVITEDSHFDKTITKAVRPFHLAERLIEITTNRKNVLRSEILLSGNFKNLLITHGFWIRGFDKSLEQNENPEDNRYKPLTTSFKDFMSSFFAVANLGMGIERNGQREIIVIEDLKYFYNRNTTIRLPFQVKNVKRSVDSSRYYSLLDFGFEKGGSYEEAQGLDEYNLKNSYTTCIHRLSNTYSALSKYNADSTGVEFTRRKPFSNYSTEDTNYDQNVYFLDAKAIGPTNNYTVRLWQDDFQNAPLGIYSPETAFNLRISPFNNLLRHSWYFGGGLAKYPADKVKYASSSGNSNLKTIYKENGSLVNSNLERSRFVPEIVKFNHVCTDEILKMVEGKSIILGKELLNVYGLIEFISENNEIEKGYLLSLKPNGVGQWELLKYNK
ncbi:hypothetical protein EG240_05865 [Paenimyroides tangerinum]|uniref:Uncharacterized protein n=1 Tax=Paenimyroides tangerinum TaxID=2488728 RepID=A0A3P3W8P5_9FLAO|nr:hypothetical protein [Paenimyroides tangerinum]RRJ91531.1 hypothetical protein EG240_05865 [Paenimyroides tangerinum]